MRDRGDVVVRERGAERVGVEHHVPEAVLRDLHAVARTLAALDARHAEPGGMDRLEGRDDLVVVGADEVVALSPGDENAAVPHARRHLVGSEHREGVAMGRRDDRLDRASVDRLGHGRGSGRAGARARQLGGRQLTGIGHAGSATKSRMVRTPSMGMSIHSGRFPAS